MDVPQPPQQQTNRTLPGIVFAQESRHVFIDLNETVTALEELVEDLQQGAITFVRAPVATGKTTLCKYLCRTFPHKYVEIDPGFSEDNFFQRLMVICNRKLFADDVTHAVKTPQDAVEALARRGRVLVIDEAHLIFGYPHAISVLTSKIGAGDDMAKILLFSAGATGRKPDGSLVATPGEILKKFMWYPPTPNPQTLVQQLEQASVHLDAESVDFFLKLCSFHRGIFMRVMEWVQLRQQQPAQQAQPAGTLSWDIHKSVAEVRMSFAESAKAEHAQAGSGWNIGIRKFMKESRAVRVNDHYSDVENIPQEFLDVLYGGPQLKEKLKHLERTLTLAGFLVPERTLESMKQEFVPYDWNNDNQTYSIANSLMSQYYRDIFRGKGYNMQMDPEKYEPSSGADLLARVLPFMSFSAVIDPPTRGKQGEINTPLSAFGLPYEVHYNRALWRWCEELGYTASQPENGGLGKTDVVVSFDNSSFAIETIMAERDVKHHNEHAGRFAKIKKTNYSAQDYKTLLSIGSDKKDLLEKALSVRRGDDVEVVACVVSQAHDSYEMYVLNPGEKEVSGPTFLYCDMVAKTLAGTNSGIESVQRKRKRE